MLLWNGSRISVIIIEVQSYLQRTMLLPDSGYKPALIEGCWLLSSLLAVFESLTIYLYRTNSKVCFPHEIAPVRRNGEYSTDHVLP